MADNSFEVDPPQIRKAGRDIADFAQRFIDEMDAFEARMEGYGQPWGNDDIGSLIGTAYTEVAAYIFDCVGIAMDEIGSAGDDVAKMADAYERADEDGASAMRSLADRLG